MWGGGGGGSIVWRCLCTEAKQPKLYNHFELIRSKHGIHTVREILGEISNILGHFFKASGRTLKKCSESLGGEVCEANIRTP